VSGPGTRKSKNLATNPDCVLNVATEPFDITVEGRADRVTIRATPSASPPSPTAAAGQHT
jgi:hypothetical protein